jgi:hypothetical protein
MTKGLNDKEQNGRDMYADIIDLPHWQSPTRPHMSLYDRAAQFSSYKALSGYEDMVAEEARLTEDKISLEDFELELLNQKLQLIADSHHPTVTFTVFVPDKTKDGGSYAKITDTVKRVDMAAQNIVLMSTRESGMNNTIDFDKIIHIFGDLVDYLDDD